MKKNLLLGFAALIICSTSVYSQGACCIDGNCSIKTRGDCKNAGGNYFGDGTQCGEVETSCLANNPFGACCTSPQTCSKETQTNCLRRGGVWIGDGIACENTNCSSVTFIASAALDYNIAVNTSYIETRNSIELKWALPDGSFNAYISRSRDGKIFKVIGNLSNELSFTDNYPYTENYYKIYFTKEGKLYSSQPIAAFAVTKGKMQVLPNPTSGKLRILLANMQTFDTEVSVIDLTGRIVLTKKINKGSHPEIDLSNLPGGTFIVKANQNGTTYTQKIQKN